MNHLRRDFLINVFQGAEIKSIDTYMFLTGSTLTLSEQSKKYFLKDYAKSKNQKYNDFNFTIMGMYFEFKSHALHMNFVLGSLEDFHEVIL